MVPDFFNGLLGVNRLLRLTFLTRAGPAPCSLERRPIDRLVLCVEGAEHVKQGTGE